MRRRPFVPAPRCLLAILIAAGACRDVPFFESPPPRSAHERYAARLAKAGLDSTTLGREWLAAAQRAIREPLTQSLPFRETGYISAAEARALAYRIDLREGQQISATAEASGGGLTLFLDLFRATGDSAEPLALVASTDSSLTRASSRLVHDVRRDGTYVLRLQPALLESGAFTLDVTTAPTLAFPVEGRDSRAVRSFFGAERDGGARDHHGIDIFAPRGTPALAAAAGVVRSIAPNNLGGNVVWLSDTEHGQTLYYAHLDRHKVTAGQRVEIGDTLGFVGNTGNARTTAPHLHFGVYRRGEGPVDPLPFVRRSSRTASPITADTAELGRVARARSTTPLRQSPEAGGAALATVASGTPLTVDAATGAWFRVRLPDGEAGYVPSRLVEQTARPLRRTDVAAGTPLRDRPAADAAVVTTADGGAMPVIGTFADYALVETAAGRTAWVASGGLK